MILDIKEIVALYEEVMASRKERHAKYINSEDPNGNMDSDSWKKWIKAHNALLTAMQNTNKIKVLERIKNELANSNIVGCPNYFID